MKFRTPILAFSMLFAGSLWASDLTIQLYNPVATLGPGESFAFYGNIFNLNANPVDLNNIDISLDGMLFQVDSTPFLSGPATVGALPDIPWTGPFELFSVTVNSLFTDTPGPKVGTVTILGGAEVANVYDPTTQNVLGTVPFLVIVTPEPGTFGLVALAALSGLWFRRTARRRNRV